MPTTDQMRTHNCLHNSGTHPPQGQHSTAALKSRHTCKPKTAWDDSVCQNIIDTKSSHGFNTKYWAEKYKVPTRYVLRQVREYKKRQERAGATGVIPPRPPKPLWAWCDEICQNIIDSKGIPGYSTKYWATKYKVPTQYVLRQVRLYKKRQEFAELWGDDRGDDREYDVGDDKGDDTGDDAGDESAEGEILTH